MSLFKLVGSIFVDTSQAEKSISHATKKADKLAKGVIKTGKNFQKTGTVITNFGKTLTKAVTLPILGIGAYSIKTAADFDEAMSNVQAISGATGDELALLRDKAKEMGEISKFSAKEAADGFSYMAMAGWKTEDMLAGIEGVMNLAAASGEDLAATSDIVTDALTAFGLKASDAGHFSDVLAAASSNANTNVSLLGETFKYCAPTAGALGYKVEDVAVAIGLMGNAGIKGSQAGTTLNNILTRMAKPTKESEAAMNRLGISLQNDQGEMYSFKEIMDQLRGAFGDINMPIEEFNSQVIELDRQLDAGEISEQKYNAALAELTKQAYGAEGAEKARAAAMLAGQRGMSGVLALVNATEADYEKLTNAIYDCDGAAKKMADTQLNNLNGQLTLLKSAVDGAAIAIGEQLTPYVSKAVGVVQKAVDWFNNLDESQKQLAIKIALVAAAIGPVLVVIGGLVSAIGTVISAYGTMSLALTHGATLFGALGAAFGAANVAAVAIVAGIAAVVAIGVLLYKNWDKIKAVAGVVWGAIKDVFFDFVEGAKNLFTSLWTHIQNIWNTICNVVKFALMLIGSIIQAYVSIITLPWRFIWENFGDIIVSTWESIKAGVSAGLSFLSGIISSVMGAIRGIWTAAWGAIQTYVLPVVSSIASGIQSILSGLAGIISGIWNGVKSVTSSVWGVIKSVVGSAINGVKSVVTSVFNGIKSTATSVWNGIKQAMIGPVQTAKEKIKGFVDDIKGFFSRLVLKLPPIKLPHFKVSGSLSLNPPSVPKLSVDWYQKAMKHIRVLDQPTIFGMGGGNLLGGGESGREIVAGEDHLMDRIAVASGGREQIPLLRRCVELLEIMIGVLEKDRIFKVGEREFGRAVHEYA